jgi:hypothetical protein
MSYTFTTDDESSAFIDEIAATMVALFGIHREEAVGRINQFWNGQSFTGPLDLIYHEDQEFWAKTVCYGADVMWWLDPPGLAPRPYP